MTVPRELLDIERRCAEEENRTPRSKLPCYALILAEMEGKSMTEREENLVNIMRGWVIALAVAIQEEDWDEVARVKDSINAEACNLLKSQRNFKV